MTLRRNFLAVAAVALAAAAGLTAAAIAAQPVAAAVKQSAKTIVDAAKARGIVGEQSDGYVGIRLDDQATAEIRGAVAEMNAGRRALYGQAPTVRSGQATLAAAGAASFNERFAEIPAGQYYRNTSGAWVRK